MVSAVTPYVANSAAATTLKQTLAAAFFLSRCRLQAETVAKSAFNSPLRAESPTRAKGASRKRLKGFSFKTNSLLFSNNPVRSSPTKLSFFMYSAHKRSRRSSKQNGRSESSSASTNCPSNYSSPIKRTAHATVVPRGSHKPRDERNEYGAWLVPRKRSDTTDKQLEVARNCRCNKNNVNYSTLYAKKGFLPSLDKTYTQFNK